MSSRFFANEPGQPRVRRTADATSIALGSFLVAWMAATAGRTSATNEAMTDLLGTVPSWFDQVYAVGYFLGLMWLLFLIGTVVVQGSQRLGLLRDMGLAIGASVAAAILLVWLVDGSSPAPFPEFASRPLDYGFPIMRVAVLAAVLVVSAPHLTRPVRRFGWVMLAVVAVAGIGLGLGLPGDALGGFGLGLAVGASILLAFGSPSGYPDTDAVASALADFGLVVESLEPAIDQSWGVRRLVGRSGDGRAVEVKAYGRDARDSQLLSRLWQSLWYRERGQTYSYSRLQSVEHEALVTLLAHRGGVSTVDVRGVGVGGDDMALLATTGRGDRVGEDQLNEDVLASMWQQIRRLHGAGIAHGSLDLAAFGIVDGNVVLADMNTASLRANDVLLSLDVVALLYSTAALVGVDTAVAAARIGVGDETLNAALPFMQPPALSRDLRHAVSKPKSLISKIRSATADALDTELPEPEKLRRIEPKSLIMPALSLVAAYVLIGMLADIDFIAVWDVVQDATWAWILIGFLVGQLVFVPEATGMLFATGYDLPLMPLVILQVSVKWIGLAVPSAAGRVTMNTIFLRKFGVPPTIALTQGALDGVAGFVVEACILILAFAVGGLSLDLDTPEVNWAVVLLIVALLVLIAIVSVLRVKRFKELILPALKDARDLLWGILKDPKRALGLLGSNLAARIVLGTVLWFFLHAIGTPLPLLSAIVATVATNLLAGLVPIPGGIGVAEAVLTTFLIMFGLSAEEAFAAAVIFRIATFYIPAVEGLFAMKWLERNGHI